jgi:hypothetical protein
MNLFDAVSAHAIASKSPILQARINQMNRDKAPQPPAAPVVNVVLPNNLYGQYPPPVLPLPIPVLQATGLIPATHEPGSKLDIATFCAIFGLSNAIYERLTENAYTATHAFAHMETTELREMGFKAGEIVDLKEAVKEWAVPRV